MEYMEYIFSDILLRIYNYSMLPKVTRIGLYKPDEESFEDDNDGKGYLSPLTQDDIKIICEELIGKIVGSSISMPQTIRYILKFIEEQAMTIVRIKIILDFRR